jgi:hypothetical protein
MKDGKAIGEFDAVQDQSVETVETVEENVVDAGTGEVTTKRKTFGVLAIVVFGCISIVGLIMNGIDVYHAFS